MKVNDEWISGFVKDIFKPGAVLVSYGMRGGGKTHCAVSYCQKLIENYYETTPKNVVLITNVIFVKALGNSKFVTESPPSVHTIHSMQEIFPIVVDTLEKFGRKDTMIILLLDEAQNFLLGDMNNVGDMASSMKKFCGIIRKFNMCLWLLSPAMRNLGPAFRNFLDAEHDPGNVNTTFQKNNQKAKRFLDRRHYNADPRSIVFVKNGFNEPKELLPVPTSSWTKDPESLKVGEYAYDHLSSADFVIGDFPFHEFVQHISGKSSYDMVSGIKEFYAKIKPIDSQNVPSDGRMTEEEFLGKWTPYLLAKNLNKGICKTFHKDPRTLKELARRYYGDSYDEVVAKAKAEAKEDEESKKKSNHSPSDDESEGGN